MLWQLLVLTGVMTDSCSNTNSGPIVLYRITFSTYSVNDIDTHLVSALMCVAFLLLTCSNVYVAIILCKAHSLTRWNK